MKKITLITLLTLSIGLFSNTSAYEIMEKNYNLKSSDSSTNTTTMVLIDKKNKKKVRELLISSKETDLGRNTYIEFLLPADVKGTKFLTITYDNDNDDQRLFLPALKKVRKISSSNKNGKFMGSDLTFYDMENKNIDDFNYQLLNSEILNNQDCWVIESIPVNNDTPYSKTINYISKNNFFSYKKLLFDKNDKHIKTMTIIETETINGIILPIKTVIENIKENHKTLLSVSNIEINGNIDDIIFTVQNLK